MKKLIASAGLIAVGTTGLQAAYAPGLSPLERSKPWSISATVRGFYDDNYATAPSSFTGKKDSYGIELSPSAAINIPLEQTYIGASYVYTMRYYEGRPNHNFDHSHEANLKLDHEFSERYRVNFNDSFAYSQEPEIIQPTGGGFSVFTRTDASALRNRATINLTAALTELLSLQPGYQNTWYDFQDSGVGSRSALLDRVEHLLHIDARYQIREHLVGLAGYQFGMLDYTSNEAISLGGPSGNSRDNESHYVYVGADYAMTTQLNATAKVGVQYTTYDSLPGNEVGPYIDLVGSYTYLPGSYVQLGVRHTRNATDIIAKDQESTSVYASVNHRFTREITGSLIGQYQYGVFSGGSADGLADNFLMLGLNVEYRFNPNFAVEAGYNFDRLDSDIPNRSFTRNRIYLGASATY